MADSSRDVVEEYREYLSRFEGTVGTCDFGAYAKHNGRLIKKLRYDEFEAKLGEYRTADHAYAQILERGDTINDVLVRLLRERGDELLLERRV